MTNGEPTRTSDRRARSLASAPLPDGAYRSRGHGPATRIWLPVLAYDKRWQTDAEYVPLDEILALSDIVTLHAPLNAETHHLLDRRRIEHMKRGAYIINTGRGPLLVRLQKLPHVLISPHTAYYTDHALNDIVENSIINCLEFERGNRHE